MVCVAWLAQGSEGTPQTHTSQSQKSTPNLSSFTSIPSSLLTPRVGRVHQGIWASKASPATPVTVVITQL